MAGVGIEFRKLRLTDSYWDILKGFGMSAGLAAGPWIATMITVGFLVLLSAAYATQAHIQVLTAGVMYAFAGSLILMGPIFLVFSRHLADQFYIGHTDQRRVFWLLQTGSIMAGVALGWPLAGYFLPSDLPHPGLLHVAGVLLFTALCGTWTALTYMDFLGRYAYPLAIFTAGSTIGLGLAYLFREMGTAGLFLGYALGMVVVHAGLLSGALRERHPACPVAPRKLSWRASLRKFVPLSWIGLMYNTGIWADKFVVWLTTGHLVMDGRMRVWDPYDVPTFMAYLVMIPGMAFFLLSVERRFYTDYRSYLDGLENDTLPALEDKRENMVRNLRGRLSYLVELQALCTVAGLFIGPFFLRRWGLSEESVQIYRLLIAAASLQIFFLSNVILLLYFEFRKEAMLLATFFCAANTLFTWLNVERPDLLLGWGYLAAAALSAALAHLVLRGRFKNLHRHIFFFHASQPAPVLTDRPQRREPTPAR